MLADAREREHEGAGAGEGEGETGEGRTSAVPSLEQGLLQGGRMGER